MDTNADKLFFQVPRILWREAHAQAESAGEPLPASSDHLLASVNEWRASQHWPLCTDMLPVAFPACDTIGPIPDDTRALWQMGLLQYIKQVETGISVMRRAITPFFAQQSTWFAHMGVALNQVLLDDTCTAYPNAMMHCFVLFDRQLKNPTVEGLRTLWESVHFYAAPTLAVSDEGKIALKIRVQHIAGVMAALLVVKDAEDSVKKQAVFPLYLSLMDGLLFLGQDKIAYRLNMLFEPLPSQLLNISVPVQKLWAQCASLSVHC